MTELHEALRRAADDVSIDLDPAALWDAGQRRHRGHVLVAAAVVLLVAAVSGLGGAALWQRTTTALPTTSIPAPSALRLPDRITTPPASLPGTADAGPIGPLVAVVGADRELRGGIVPGLAGVSGRTGEYRFLDLPGVATGTLGDTAALSPDGHWVAYWLAGPRPTTTTALTSGVALYDTVTGAVRTHSISSRLGLMPERITWVRPTAWFTSNEVTRIEGEGVTSKRQPPARWNPAAAEPEAASDLVPEVLVAAPDGATLVRGFDDLVVDAPGQEPASVPLSDSSAIGLQGGFSGVPVLSSAMSGRRAIAFVTSGGSTAPRILVGSRDEVSATRDRGSAASERMPPAQRVRLEPVPGLPADPEVAGGTRLLGWRDPDHLIVSFTTVKPNGARVASVDVHSGAIEPVTWFEGDTWWIVAADAWATGPAATNQSEPSTDARPIGVGIAGAVVALALAGWGVAAIRGRRRGRA